MFIDHPLHRRSPGRPAKVPPSVLDDLNLKIVEWRGRVAYLQILKSTGREGDKVRAEASRLSPLILAYRIEFEGELADRRDQGADEASGRWMLAVLQELRSDTERLID